MIAERSNEIFSDFRIPGIVATKCGTLLRYCECRRSHGDWADIDIKISRSDDGGESFCDVLLIKSEGNTLNNPVMFVDGEKLVFLYCKNYKELYRMFSFDDGRSFSEPERLDIEKGIDFFYNVIAVGPGHGIKHGDKLIVPAWFAHNEQDEHSHHPSTIATIYSTDGGESFRIGERIFVDELVNPSECALAVNSDGDVVISIRHEGEKRCRAIAISPDGISQWRDLYFEEKLADPICMGSMTHDGKKIYHINCSSDSTRSNLTVKITDQNFKCFDEVHVSDTGGYSDIALLGDKLCIFYETKNANGAWELYFKVI